MSDTTRREAFRRCGRLATAVGLGALGVALVRKRANPAQGRQTCVNQGICRGCGVFAGCGLPQALSAKRALVRQEADHG
jgi:hypothetical protein